MTYSYIRVIKSRLTDYVRDKCTEDQLKDFYDQVEEECGQRSVSALNETKVKWLAKVITYQAHGVKEVIEDDRW